MKYYLGKVQQTVNAAKAADTQELRGHSKMGKKEECESGEQRKEE